MQPKLAWWVCVTESVCVWCLCKHFHVGLQQREKRRRENGYGRQMSLGILASSFSLMQLLSVLCIHAHRHARAHTLSNGKGQWPHTQAYKHLQLVTYWKAVKTPPPPHPPHHQTESCPLPLIWTLSHSLDLYHYSGHSFLFVGGVGGGVSSYIFLSSLPSLIPCNSANKISLGSAIACLELCWSGQWVVLL